MANSLLTAGASNDASASSASKGQTVAKDTRIFMYRAGESRLFNAAEEIPPGEGWVDHPDKVALVTLEEAPKAKRGPGRPRKLEAPEEGDE